MEDDEVDACSGALEMLNPRTKSWRMFEVTRQKAEQLLAEQRPKPQRANPYRPLAPWNGSPRTTN